MKPLCIDLFCGLGGWAEGFILEGYRVVGYDIDPQFKEPYEATGGEFVCADVRTLDGRQFKGATVIVASPPCNEFSKLNDIGHRRKGPPDRSLFDAVMRIRSESGVPTVVENVDRAQAFVGKSRCHRGAYFLWGDVPMLPQMKLRPKIGGSFMRSRPSYKHRRHADSGSPAERARIPKELSRAIARGFIPATMDPPHAGERNAPSKIGPIVAEEGEA